MKLPLITATNCNYMFRLQLQSPRYFIITNMLNTCIYVSNLTHTLSESKCCVYTFVRILQAYYVIVLENIK